MRLRRRRGGLWNGGGEREEDILAGTARKESPAEIPESPDHFLNVDESQKFTRDWGLRNTNLALNFR